MLHSLTEFIPDPVTIPDTTPTYWYEGRCPQTGAVLRLPRTSFVETIARQLMQRLAVEAAFNHEGKMYGVLLVETAAGETAVLQAFSGLLQGRSQIEGWVPPIPGRQQVAIAEAKTLTQLNAIRQKILDLQQIPERQQHDTQLCQFETRSIELNDKLRQRKQERQQERQRLHQILTGEELAIALEHLNEQSRQDGIQQRHLKRERQRTLQPLEQIITSADAQIKQLKQHRQQLSRTLQQQMHETYRLMNFLGTSIALQQLLPQGMPTGTGECCAPKLLHYAATQGLKPIALAEFWWGPPSSRQNSTQLIPTQLIPTQLTPTQLTPTQLTPTQLTPTQLIPTQSDKIPGEFYGACPERCQPLMGFLLSGLPPIELTNLSLPILYEDDWLIAVNKPAGLLTIPGRSGDRQDSVLTRLRSLQSNGTNLRIVHRLDRETSGILILARHSQSQQHLSQQFQQRRIQKNYEALLVGTITTGQGTINLPIGGDYREQPRRKIDWQSGKPSITHFQVLEHTALADATPITRVEFKPVTGRTHQLRIHAIAGLGAVILGDRLYGCQQDCQPAVDRLHLHARELQFAHPQSGQQIQLQTQTPF